MAKLNPKALTFQALLLGFQLRTLAELILREAFQRFFDMLAATRPCHFATAFASNWTTQFKPPETCKLLLNILPFSAHYSSRISRLITKFLTNLAAK
jgi:hypothetical protein